MHRCESGLVGSEQHAFDAPAGSIVVAKAQRLMIGSVECDQRLHVADGFRQTHNRSMHDDTVHHAPAKISFSQEEVAAHWLTNTEDVRKHYDLHSI